MPRELGGICDTIYFSSIRNFKLPHAHEPTPTVCFRTTYEADYLRLGEPLPAEGKLLKDTNKPFYWFKSLPADDRRRIRKDLGWPSRRRWPTMRLRLSDYLPHRLSRPVMSANKPDLIGRFGNAPWIMHESDASAKPSPPARQS
jgi:hypothetical protein